MLKIDEVSLNVEWLCNNSEHLKQIYNNKWVIIEDQKIVNVADTLEESAKAKAKHKTSAIAEFITTEKIEYVFFRWKNILFKGYIYEKHLVIPVFVQIPKHRKEGNINFVIDTGSGKTMLSVNAAAHIGVDCRDFPVCKGCGSGLGGSFEAWLINCPVKFVFGKDTSESYTVSYDTGLQISVPSSKLSVEEQIAQHNMIPSLLGTDILLKYFEMFISKDRIELTPLK